MISEEEAERLVQFLVRTEELEPPVRQRFRLRRKLTAARIAGIPAAA